jgi:hypothetical protein
MCVHSLYVFYLGGDDVAFPSSNHLVVGYYMLIDSHQTYDSAGTYYASLVPGLMNGVIAGIRKS